MRIISIKKGLEVDSSEGDYYGDYEGFYEEIQEKIPIYDFFLSLYYELENEHPELLEKLSPGVNKSDFEIILKYISKNGIDYKKIFDDVFKDYWEENSLFNEEKFKRLSELSQQPVRTLDGVIVFHKNSNIFDLFRRRNPLVLFSPSIGVEIGKLLNLDSKAEFIYNKEKFELSLPQEFFSFLLLISISCYENQDKQFNFLDIYLFPNDWEFEENDILQNLEHEGIIYESPSITEINSIKEIQFSNSETNGFQIISADVRKDLMMLNSLLFNNFSYLEIREDFKNDLRQFYTIIGKYIVDWLVLLEELNNASARQFLEQIEQLITAAKELIKERKRHNAITEKQRKEYRDLTKEINNNPGSYFFRIYNREEINSFKRNIKKYFHDIFPYMDFPECETVLKNISKEIINYNAFIGRSSDAIVYSIISKNYLMGAELYKQKKMKSYSCGMTYREEKAKAFSNNQDFNRTQKRTVPIIIDLYPHPETQINVAMVQIHVNEDYFEKSEDSNEFFIKEEKEEEIFSYVKKIIDKLKELTIHIIVFPELIISFNPKSKYYFYKYSSPLRNLFIEDSFVKNRIIIPGTFYSGRRNIAPIIFPSSEIIYTIKQTLSNLESSVLEDVSVIKGNCTPVFYTNYGKFAVLICRDLLNDNLVTEVLGYGADIIFNPCANKDILRFGNRASSIVENNSTYIFQPNCFSKDKINYSSSIFSILDRKDIETLKEKDYKKDSTLFGVYNSEANRNEIIVVSIELEEKRLSVPSIGSDESNIPLKLLHIINLDGFNRLNDFSR